MRRKTFVTCAIVTLVLLVALWPGFESGAGLMDEGMILVYPEMMQRGKLPYRDFETFYGPANPALIAAAFSGFGANIFVERTMGLIYRLLIVLAIFAIVQRWDIILASGCMFVTGCLLVVTHLPAYAWFGAMACGLWSLWIGGPAPSDRRALAAGFLAGLALLFRFDVAPAIAISALPFLHAMSWHKRWRYFGGAACGLLPLGILTVVAGVGPVADNLFMTPVIHSSPARHLPVLAAEPYLVSLFIMHLIAAALNVAAGIVAVRAKPRDQQARLLLALALFGAGLTHQAAQRLDLTHLLFAVFASIGVLPLSLYVLRARFRPASNKTTALLAIVLVIACVQAIAPELTMLLRNSVASVWRADGGATFIEQGGRSFPFNSPNVALNVSKMLKTLDALSAPGARLFVGPADLRRTNYSDTFIYHMMPKLTPATYFLEMNPLSANRPGSRLADDIKTADWLVLNRMWDSWQEPNRSVEYGSEAPNLVVQREFEPAGEFGSYILLRRKVGERPAG